MTTQQEALEDHAPTRRLRAALAPGEHAVVVPLEEVGAGRVLLEGERWAAVAAQWEALAPGADLAAAVDRADPAALAGYDLLELIAGIARLEAWVEAAKDVAWAELARRRPAPVEPNRRGRARAEARGVSEFAADEIAARLRLPRAAVQTRLAEAVDLTTRLPATLAALRAGRICRARARAVVQHTATCTPEAARAVEEHVLRRAPDQTAAQLRPCVQRRVLRVEPAAAAARHARARAHRAVWLRPEPDGMATLGVHLPAQDAMSVFGALDGRARAARAAGDARPLDALRADALIELARHALRECPRPLATRHGRRPQVHVVVAATTLLGLDDRPAELRGYGPVPADVARTIAADATWRRLIVDADTGRLLDYGRRTYRPPQALRDHVIARDVTCTALGCAQPAETCDIDHAREYPDGPTSDRNTLAGCRHHHRSRHTGGWDLARDDTGTTWRAPTGHTYRTDVPPVLGDWDRDDLGALTLHQLRAALHTADMDGADTDTGASSPGSGTGEQKPPF